MSMVELSLETTYTFHRSSIQSLSSFESQGTPFYPHSFVLWENFLHVNRVDKDRGQATHTG